MDKVEFLVLKNLIHNEKYLRKVLPFIKEEYFDDTKYKVIFDEISTFTAEYNELPTKEILNIEIEKRRDINEDSYKQISHVVN